jgi:hypothetical protein
MIQEFRNFQETAEGPGASSSRDDRSWNYQSGRCCALPRVSDPSAQPPESGYRGSKTHVVQFRSARERRGNFC